jgi:Skp family chaperone for outer membrane proteins
MAVMSRKALALALTTAATFLLTSTTFAQTDRPQAPARIGNIYNHQDHQPTQVELEASGIPAPSARTEQQVEKEIQELLQETDRQDRKAEESEREQSHEPDRR